MKRGWILEPLAAIAHVAMGQSPPSTTYNMTGEGLPFLQGKFEFGEVYPTPVRFCSKPLRVAEQDDILVSVRAPVGPVNLSPAKCCIGRGLAAVRGQPTRIDQLYLFYYLRSAQQEISALGQGSTFGAIGRRDVEGIEVPHPIDLREQRRVASILQRAHQLKAKRKDANLPAARLVQAVFLKMFGDPETNPKGWTTQPLGSVLREKL